MSSYQFVNSLGSCYGPGRAGPDGGVGAPPSDYYSQQQQLYNSWSNATNQANVAAAAAAVAASVAQSPASPPYYLPQNGDHGAHHLPHHRDLYSNNTCAQQAALINPAGRLSHHSSQQQLMQQQQQASRTSTSPSSCKFGLDSTSSPQDLSTSSGGAGQSPEPRSSGSPRGNSNQNSSQQSSNGNANSQSKGNFGSSGNQPHIYPWMRKVHVGQSKSLFSAKFRKASSSYHCLANCQVESEYTESIFTFLVG